MDLISEANNSAAGKCTILILSFAAAGSVSASRNPSDPGGLSGASGSDFLSPS